VEQATQLEEKPSSDSLQTPLHSPAHNFMGRVPTDSQQVTSLAHAVAGVQLRGQPAGYYRNGNCAEAWLRCNDLARLGAHEIPVFRPELPLPDPLALSDRTSRSSAGPDGRRRARIPADHRPRFSRPSSAANGPIATRDGSPDECATDAGAPVGLRGADTLPGTFSPWVCCRPAKAPDL
jgi:hypothetical protein